MKETTFKGVKLTDEGILAEMHRFDAELRDKFTAWGTWAIERDEKYYPPKTILSMASGIDVDQFNGGKQTNDRFKELDFTVVRRPGSAEVERALERLGLQPDIVYIRSRTNENGEVASS